MRKFSISIFFISGIFILFSEVVAAKPKDSIVVVIVHPDNPIQNVSSALLARIFLGKTKKWKDGKRIRPFQSRFQSSSRRLMRSKVFYMEDGEVKEYWMEQRIKGQASSPRTTNSDAAVAAYVGRNPSAIGFISLSAIKHQKVKVISVDGHKPSEGKAYPFYHPHLH